MVFKTHHTRIPPPKPPAQAPKPVLNIKQEELLEADLLIRAAEGRTRFLVWGSGLTAAVLDTGINAHHVDFDSGKRVVAEVNFTGESGIDINGHGTNVAGIIAAGGDHMGVAPAANIAALKVLGEGEGSFQQIADALDWILERHEQHKITVVCMSLGDRGNYPDDLAFAQEGIRERFLALRERRIAVVVASGNDYFGAQGQGMSFPAILRECISVGAVYDANVGPQVYGQGASAFTTAEDRITPFSQRLHHSVNGETFTTIFAPGAPIRSTGIEGPRGESTQQGTSQATPIVVGAILLLQELYLRKMHVLPQIADLARILRASGADIFDGDDEDDNVEHTGLAFKRVDVLAALQLMTETIDAVAKAPNDSRASEAVASTP